MKNKERKIKVGEEEYRIRLVRYLKKCRNKKQIVAGDFSCKRNEIKIKNNISEKQKEETLYHEIAHAILYELGKYNKPIQKLFYNENFIDRLGKILSQTFKIRYLNKND